MLQESFWYGMSVLSVFSREMEPTGYIWRERQKEIYYRVLADGIMEAKKSQDLLSASWKFQKVGVIVSIQTQIPENQGSQEYKYQSEPKGLRTRGTDVEGQEKTDVLAQSEKDFALPLPFCSIQTLIGLEEDNLLYSVYRFRC